MLYTCYIRFKYFLENFSPEHIKNIEANSLTLLESYDNSSKSLDDILNDINSLIDDSIEVFI